MATSNRSHHSIEAVGLADILERVLDKGIVIAGDIKISIADIELISIKVRLLVASVDKAKELGINWWTNDPYLSSEARQNQLERIEAENRELKARLEALEAGTGSTS